MLHKDCFIDLPNLELPFNHTDILTDIDYELLESSKTPTGAVNSKNITWFNSGHTNTDLSNRKVSLMGMITDATILKEIKNFYRNNFKEDIVDFSFFGPAKHIMGVTLITFSDNTPWHREGFNPDWTSRNFEQQFTQRHPYKRFNYAINFPLYVKDGHKTKVEFAKTTRPIQDIENRLMVDMMRKSSVEEKFKGISVSTSLDQINDADKWKDNIHVIDTKHGYDCPYIINLSSYHKVTTTNATRLSLRFMGSNKYTWNDLENFYNKGELLKHV